ncbi:helix-turn-helix transcriptional regulator [Streptomyces sp. NPDC088124]|uniref:helix-turn-helix domain-containing protein n=1 Tax=Streptomyces sp. NPDC088124 TaxID=3154654 RepID=UPI003444B32B
MTQKRATPTIKRRRVGAQLRRWRGEMRSGDAARLMDWDTTRLSRIERGLYRISGEDVRELCKKLGVEDQAAVDEVAKVAEEPAGSGWWAPYASLMSPAYLDFIELETEAQTIRIQHPKVIPGLVQSHGYVREILSHARTTTEATEPMVTVRLARQEVLTRTSKPVQFHGLIPESAFHARFESGPGLMKDQMRKLLDASQMPNIKLQIVPLTAHPSYGSNGSMTIFTFQHPWTPVASVDNPMGGSHTYDLEQVGYLETEFDHIASIALPVDESRDLMNEYLEGLHK